MRARLPLAPWLTLAVTLSLVAGASCTRARPTRPRPVSASAVGQCSDPAQSGVVGKRPRLTRADRDLDGDARPEVVVADRNLCSAAGNCYWNVYSEDRAAGCHRYAGTVAASVIDRLARRGDDGFFDLRGWWQLTRGSRILLQEYRYRHGGYRIVDAMVCRQQEDDRLLCASEGN